MTSTEGLKHDAGKAPIARGFLRYFPRAIEGVALISQFGFDKYKEWGGWKTVPDAYNRYDDAHGRHDVSLQRGETHCPESHKLHLAHRAWNAMATLELYLIEEEAKRAEATLEQDRCDKSWSDAAFADHQEQVKAIAAKDKEKADRYDLLKKDAIARHNGENLDGSVRRETVTKKFVTCGKCDDPLECAGKDRCFGR